jgi:hypothetical protein
VVLSPKSTDVSAECDTFFGFVRDGSVAPPEGSGEITIYDYAQNEYNATYTPSTIKVDIQECAYEFNLELNVNSKDGMYKFKQLEHSGPSCPSVETSCFESYWVTTNALGLFAFIDTSVNSCPAFFAHVNPGSDNDGGTFSIAGVAADRMTAWVPPGYSGKYGMSTGIPAIWISTPECRFEFRLEMSNGDSTTVDFPSESPPPTAGAAVLDFYGVSPQTGMCLISCMTDGYNVVWDATGDHPPLIVSRSRARPEIRRLSRR